MKEDFLHYIWKNKLFDAEKMLTRTGQAIEVIHPGIHNLDSGPDFFNARIKIGNKIWAGNVEIHVKASDWLRHGHIDDQAYDNVILQVVYQNDAEITQASGKKIHNIELSFDPEYYAGYCQLMSSKRWIPCEDFVTSVDDLTITHWRDNLMVERLERKSNEVIEKLKIHDFNWEEVFYHRVARNFGFKINAEPFELLAKSLPLRYLGKHKDHLHQIEAMLFGQAGLLDKQIEDEYYQQLKKEYSFLQQKFQLSPLDAHLWKFMRLRPPNFPTIRIAQFSQLVHQSSGLFSKIIETPTIDALASFFDIKASAYWDTHYVFGKESRKRIKKLGTTAFHTIVINTIVPFLFVYGKYTNKEKLKDRAFDFLTALPPEKNSIIDKWQELNVKIDSAFDSQAHLQLTKEYCKHGKCLQCKIGHHIIRNKKIVLP